MPQTCFAWALWEERPPRRRQSLPRAVAVLRFPAPQRPESGISLPPAVLEDVSRALGEMLVQQYRADSESIVKPRSGLQHSGPMEGDTHG